MECVPRSLWLMTPTLSDSAEVVDRTSNRAPSWINLRLLTPKARSPISSRSSPLRTRLMRGLGVISSGHRGVTDELLLDDSESKS